MKSKQVVLSLAVCAALFVGLSRPAWAVNGAQPGGNGAANAAMGGASIALPLDSEAAANNPAGLAFVPSSMTLGLQVFHGNSSSHYVLPGNTLHNSETTFGPEGGVNWHVSSHWAVGLSVNFGGAGADYGQPALPVPDAPNAKTSLQVIELVPTVAWRPSDNFAIGVGPNLAYERFEAQGVIVPAPVPGGLLPLPKHGQQQATGVGMRMGILWKLTSDLSLGASLKSRTSMGRLAGYEKDLLAYSDGHLDIPSQYGVGIAWRATPNLTLAGDWLRINWGDLRVMKDPDGFRWRNQPVWRVGAAFALDDAWTLRAGYSHSQRQITSDVTVQNLFVPSINNRAFTAGITRRLNQSSSVNLGYEFNPKTTLQGSGLSTGTSLTSKVQMLMASYQHDI
ncbi:OmpP1/FadL family transporter [Dyella sp. Tek66A03]|uniref:OmpP1/FadL family transporter n=1 Tax=Dyella sp. Tek66A03 TaxID=3458298 RepID=UPI00403EA796